MAAYVVCPQCGTRIKAGRAHCLRCLADLPAPDAPVRLPVWVSLGLSGNQQAMVAVIASLLVVALVTVIWRTAPEKADEQPRPAAPAAASTRSPRADVDQEQPAAAPEIPTVVQASPAVVPHAAVDANRLGAAAYARGDFEAARAAYEEALAKAPNDAETLNNLGQVLVRLNRTPEAIARFERAITLVPDKSTYHFNLAFAVAQLNQWDRAVAEYREATKLFPTDYAAQFNLATALQKKGDQQAAIPEFEKAITLAPSEPSFHLSLGMALERVGRTADAVREYKTYLSMDPNGADAGRLKEHVDTLAARGGTQSASVSR